jgi:ECF transporter S component (folate family)
MGKGYYMQRVTAKVIVFMGLFIAMEVVLARFLSIQTPIVRIGFTFLPVALSAMLYGPLYSGIAAALADIVGMFLFSSGGAYFPGFTLTAFLSGVIYGLFLHNKNRSFLRVAIPVVIISLGVNLGLDTLWLQMLTGKGFIAILPARIIKCLIMIPIQIIIIEAVWRYLGNQLMQACKSRNAESRVL